MSKPQNLKRETSESNWTLDEVVLQYELNKERGKNIHRYIDYMNLYAYMLLDDSIMVKLH